MMRALVSCLWAVFMLVSTHFMFGVSWAAGLILWSFGGLLFWVLLHTRLAQARRSPREWNAPNV